MQKIYCKEVGNSYNLPYNSTWHIGLHDVAMLSVYEVPLHQIEQTVPLEDVLSHLVF